MSDQEAVGRAWAGWTRLKALPDQWTVEEAPRAASDRERRLMYLDGWESMQRLGRIIWRHPEHTGGFWTGEEVAVQWARERGDWPQLPE